MVIIVASNELILNGYFDAYLYFIGFVAIIL